MSSGEPLLTTRADTEAATEATEPPTLLTGPGQKHKVSSVLNKSAEFASKHMVSERVTEWLPWLRSLSSTLRYCHSVYIMDITCLYQSCKPFVI
jgi:CO dehydrogenase/acetyl-CoA synthase delta subunit